MGLDFTDGCGLNGLGLSDRSGIGLEALLAGRKLSSRTSTKFEGNSPIIRLSRRSLPIHHDPSPALRHSIRSPSTNPRSRLDCVSVSILNHRRLDVNGSRTSPPQLYTARHQHGNRVGRLCGSGMLEGCAQFAPWEIRSQENIDASCESDGGVEVFRIALELQEIYLGIKSNAGLAAALQLKG